MEILLNLAWAAIALGIVCLWFHAEPEVGRDRRRQLIAMAVLIAILFPVISVSDDLMALQTATEVDSCPRRDHLLPPGTDPGLPVATILPLSFFAYATSGSVTYTSPTELVVPQLADPESPSIQNRPPPAA